MTRVPVGAPVRHVDGTETGVVARLVGRAGVGDGLHARVAWDGGGTSIVRLDLLVAVDPTPIDTATIRAVRRSPQVAPDWALCDDESWAVWIAQETQRNLGVSP